MLHQLVMVVGSCPGVGKSTIAASIAEQLASKGVPTECLLEDSLAHLDVLAPIREGFQKENPDVIGILLGVAKDLAEEFVHSPKVHIIDAFLPGYHYLFGLYATTTISAYSASLYDNLCSLHPMLIYLLSDVPSAIRQAVEERGQEWFEEFLDRINRHSRTGCCERTSLPLSSMEDVFAYFNEMDQLAQEKVREWRGRQLVIDTADQTVDEIKLMVVDSWMQGTAA